MSKSTIVRVNRGSGCIFKLYNQDYDYVLTAKHNLDDVNKVTWKNPETLIVVDIDILSEPLTHTNVDAAILKIRKFKDVDIFYIPYEYKTNLEITLSGYPKIRKSPDEFRANNGTTHNLNEKGLLELELNGAPTFTEVNGMSGGPIVIKDSPLELLAIQSCMVKKDDEELLGRTLCIPFSFYESVITEKNNAGESLECLTSVSLQSLFQHTFKLDDLETSKEILTRTLHLKAKKASQLLSIDEIKEVYNNNLSLQEGKEVLNKNYWIGLLEVLTLKSIDHDLEINKANLQKIKSDFRIVYGEIEKLWREAIVDLYDSDLRKLGKNSNVFIVTNKDKTPTRVEYSPKLLMNIAQVPIEEMRIDIASIGDPFSDIKIKHIYSIQKHIIDKEETFQGCNATNVNKIIKEVTNDFF